MVVLPVDQNNNTSKANTSRSNEPLSERFPALEEQEVKLTLFAPEAKQVQVAGNFNDWRPDSMPMKNMGEGDWTLPCTLRSGAYEYRFVVDGRWMEDPLSVERAPNPFGEYNSVLMVPLSVRTDLL